MAEGKPGDGKQHSHAGADAASAHAEERKQKLEIAEERADLVTTRRQIMKVATVALGAVAVGAAALPAAIAAVFPAGERTVREPEDAIDACALADVLADRPLRVDLVAADSSDAWLHKQSAPLGAVYLRKKPDGKLECLSSVCPHLGCFVEWEDAKKRFACPCHASVFDEHGARVSGPAPRGMDDLPATPDGDRVKVKFARFLNNIPERVKT